MYPYLRLYYFFFFFFNDTATTEIYTLSLHDALPISGGRKRAAREGGGAKARPSPYRDFERVGDGDRKSTRLNSSHSQISYAVFCLKKKKIQQRLLNVYMYIQITGLTIIKIKQFDFMS